MTQINTCDPLAGVPESVRRDPSFKLGYVASDLRRILDRAGSAGAAELQHLVDVLTYGDGQARDDSPETS